MGVKTLPPILGTKIDEALKHNKYQMKFLQAHSARVCPTCRQLVPANDDGSINCPKCERLVLKPRRAYDRFGLFAGRRGGKTKIGAVAGLKEMAIPFTNGIIASPSYPKLFELDSTFDTFLSRIPRHFVADWDSEYYDLTLINGSRVGFRSFEDPQRARGGGIHWMWLDEGREIAAEAWEVAEPSLTEYEGVAILTTSPRGEDWCFEKFWDTVYRQHLPGYWAIKWMTSENPIIKKSTIDRRRLTTSKKMFAQEYEADFVTFEGAIYEDITRETHYLADEAAVKRYLPEWPNIDPSRKVLVGLDSGADHPFGGVVAIPTPHGIICVREYLKRDTALVVHKRNLLAMVGHFPDIRWSANKNERQLAIEFAQDPYPINLFLAENDVWGGIQRTQSWLYSKKLFITYACPQLWTQLKSYHMAPNILKSGEKRNVEKVYKKKDELPDALRYLLMAWPELPVADELSTARKVDDIPEDCRWAWLRQQEINQKNKLAEEGLTPLDDGYPLGDFYQ